jgi:predicted extracellular nuclease
VANFNGDDAVVLRGTGGVVDSFGQVGFDPGTQWTGGGLDDTLTRIESVCAGDTNPNDVFDASVEWNVFSNNTFTELGSHTANCDGPVNAPVVAVCDDPIVTDEGVEAVATLSASDADGTVVDIFVVVDPVPGAGSISIANLLPAASEGGVATADLVVDASVPAGNYEVTVTAANDDAEQQMGQCVQSVTVQGDLPTTFIHDIQGSTDTSPLMGQTVVIEGVVVGDYEGAAPALRGFYVQEEDADADADPNTSEGVFVFNFSNDSVSLGDQVRVRGDVAEFQGQTQLNFPDSVEVISTGNAVTAAVVSLPLATSAELERFEGMLVTFPQTLYVTEHFQLGRFGQVVVSSGDRLPQPTSITEPGAPAQAIQAANDLNRLIVDDADNAQNADPIVFGRGGNELTATNTLRGGDTLTGAVGVMTYTWAGNAASGNAYRLRPLGDLSDTGLVPGGVAPTFVTANSRPTDAPVVGGSGKVASFNVLNYFVSIDDGVDECGPTGFEQDCRGADSVLELDRQRDKLIPAILQIDADVLGLIELENTTGVEPLEDIVSELNARTAPGTYDYIATGTIGTDVIKVGIIYQPDRATPNGAFAILDSSVDSRFDDELNRPALAQSFVSDDETFTVVVNHLKSKGCGGDLGLDMDQGDGAGCFNLARTSAAEAELDWIASDPTGVGDGDFLVLGDLNSYAMEDPIDVFVDAGFVDLGRLFGGEETYSYVFDGQWGYLDYALASPTMAAKITGTGEYHINSDEPSVLDYNTDFQSSNQVEILYNEDEFRTSDHDPVVVGYCEAVAPAASAMATPSEIWPPNGQLRSISIDLDVTDANAFAVELVSITSNEPIVGEVVVIDDTHVRLRAERDDEGPGRTYMINYLATDDCGNTTEFSATVVVLHDQGKKNQPV